MMKKPRPLAFVKQANFAHGAQQINNAPPPAQLPRARKSKKSPNKLLEQKHDKWLDTGATSPAISADPQLATVGEIDRTENG
jgi:hypothetical protein